MTAIRGQVEVSVVQAFALDRRRPAIAVNPHQPRVGITARRNVDERSVVSHTRHRLDVFDHGHGIHDACGIAGIESGGEHRCSLLEYEPALGQVQEAVTANAKIADRSFVRVGNAGCRSAIRVDDGDEQSAVRQD
jgi:hypothetical protein